MATGTQSMVRRSGDGAPLVEGAERRSPRISFCRGLTKPERARLESLSKARRLVPGEMLCVIGAPAEHVFSVASGVLKLYKTLADGRRQISRFLFPEDFFGPTRASVGYPWAVQSVTAAQAWCFERRAFAELLHAVPELEHRLLGMAWEELESAREHMLLLAHKGAEEKIASFLLWLARRQGGRHDNDVLVLPMTRRDIAEYLGLKTETVSRTLRGLHRSGVITFSDPGHAALMRRDVLATLASGRRSERPA